MKEGDTPISDAPKDSQYKAEHVDMTPINALHYTLIHFLDFSLKFWSSSGTFMLTKCLLIFKLHKLIILGITY